MISYNPYQFYGALPQETHLSKVHGIEGAESYPMLPNSEAFLLDDSSDIVYFKMTDAGGYATVKKGRWVELPEENNKPDAMQDIYSRLEAIEKRLGNVDTADVKQP